jgi:hypothetical protein
MDEYTSLTTEEWSSFFPTTGTLYKENTEDESYYGRIKGFFKSTISKDFFLKLKDMVEDAELTTLVKKAVANDENAMKNLKQYFSENTLRSFNFVRDNAINGAYYATDIALANPVTTTAAVGVLATGGVIWMLKNALNRNEISKEEKEKLEKATLVALMNKNNEILQKIEKIVNLQFGQSVEYNGKLNQMMGIFHEISAAGEVETKRIPIHVVKNTDGNGYFQVENFKQAQSNLFLSSEQSGGGNNNDNSLKIHDNDIYTINDRKVEKFLKWENGKWQDNDGNKYDNRNELEKKIQSLSKSESSDDSNSNKENNMNILFKIGLPVLVIIIIALVVMILMKNKKKGKKRR